MQSYVIVGLGVCIAILVILLASASNKKRKVFKNNTYHYVAKKLPMTKTEAEFFIKLESVVGERYYVFPQVHLSSLLDHHIKDQEWYYAFRHINGKSVDYVLCSKSTLKPTYVIELDDCTHDRSDRRKRDAEVERIFKDAGLPLVRFKDKNVSVQHIAQTLSRASKL